MLCDRTDQSSAGTVSLFRFPLLIKSWTYDLVEPSGEVDVTLSLVLAPEQTALIAQIHRLELDLAALSLSLPKTSCESYAIFGWISLCFCLPDFHFNSAVLVVNCWVEIMDWIDFTPIMLNSLKLIGQVRHQIFPRRCVHCGLWW